MSARRRVLPAKFPKIFVDTDAELRFRRRLGRDTRERGRALDSLVQQELARLRPMRMQCREPLKRYADGIIPEAGCNDAGIDLVIQKLPALLWGRAWAGGSGR
jgi:uridine kinase